MIHCWPTWEQAAKWLHLLVSCATSAPPNLSIFESGAFVAPAQLYI